MRLENGKEKWLSWLAAIFTTKLKDTAGLKQLGERAIGDVKRIFFLNHVF